MLLESSLRDVQSKVSWNNQQFLKDFLAITHVQNNTASSYKIPKAVFFPFIMGNPRYM